MGRAQSHLRMMIISLSFFFLLTASCGATADRIQMRLYRGVDRKIEITPEVRTALEDLNRYCGPSYGYSYNNGYNNYNSGYSSGYNNYNNGYNNGYNRPTNSIGNLVTPVVFGLAAAGAG